MKRSEHISEFLKLIQRSKTEYACSRERVIQQDKLTQDLMHDLELNEHSYKERAKIATELRSVRRERRIDKNVVEVTEKIKEVVERADMQYAINAFTRLLGEVRKVEQYHENRTYRRKAELNGPRQGNSHGMQA